MFPACARLSEQEVVGLLAGRTGQFLMESGHNGDTWLELDGLFIRPARVARLAGELAQRISAHGVEAVCEPLVGGAFLAEMVASPLDVELTADLGFADQSHVCCVIRSETGHTPSALRRAPA
jgi:hypothetical protein